MGLPGQLCLISTPNRRCEHGETRNRILSSVDRIQQLSLYSVKNNPQKHCGKPTEIYPTNYDSLYVALISACFDLRCRRNLGKERNGATQILQYIPRTENNGFSQLYAYDPKHTSHKTSKLVMYLNMDYEMHMGTNLDYLFFQSSRLLQASEVQLSKKQCETERTQILTILMLSLENPRLAG